jgi:transposase-like protein
MGRKVNMKYSKERKNAVIKKMLPPQSRTVIQLHEEENIALSTLYKWQSECRQNGSLQIESDLPNWDSKRKFSAVLAVASMNEAEKSAYCREHGIYPEYIERWKTACENANDWDRSKNIEMQKKLSTERLKTKDLDKQLRRKEKALAEAAALLLLQKKSNALVETLYRGEDQ